MSGTEWTEPGQGATVAELRQKFGRIMTLTTKEADAVMGLLDNGKRKDWSVRTNLRLTGAPLTAEDLKRIAECK